MYVILKRFTSLVWLQNYDFAATKQNANLTSMDLHSHHHLSISGTCSGPPKPLHVKHKNVDVLIWNHLIGIHSKGRRLKRAPYCIPGWKFNIKVLYKRGLGLSTFILNGIRAKLNSLQSIPVQSAWPNWVLSVRMYIERQGLVTGVFSITYHFYFCCCDSLNN